MAAGGGWNLTLPTADGVHQRRNYVPQQSLLADEASRGSSAEEVASAARGTAQPTTATMLAGAQLFVLILIGITLIVLAAVTLSNVLASKKTLSGVSDDLYVVGNGLQRHYDVEEVPAQSGTQVDWIGTQEVVANFCTKARPVSSFGCNEEPCLIPLDEFESDTDFLDLTSSSRILVKATNNYRIRIIVKGRTMCPFHRVLINVVNIDPSNDDEKTVLAFGYLGSHSSLNLSIIYLASEDNVLGIEVADYSANSGLKLSIDGIVTKTDDYDHLMQSTTHDLSQGVAWIPSRPITAPPSPSLQFPPQYPTSSSVYPWLSPVIPASPIGGALPFGVPNDWGHHKFQSVPFSIGDFMGLDMESIDPADPQLSLFLTDRQYRGKDERRKAVYMTALRACVVQEAYTEKIRAFLNRVYSDVTTYHKPLMSAYKVALVDFLLDVHVGVAQHPQSVKTFFDEFVTFLGVGDPTAPGRNERVLLGRELIPSVRAYFSARNSIVIDAKDASSIIYYWHIAGLAPEGLVMETVHNAIAFAQFLNVLHKLVVDKISGTVQPVAGTIQYNFFDKYTACGSDAVCKLNVGRETMRLTVPNSVSFSRVEDPDSTDSVTSRLLHQSVMIAAWANLTGVAAAYFGYNAGIYSSIIDYNTSIDDTVCTADDAAPITAAEPDQLFTRAALTRDNQTFFDANNDKLIPAFELPIYAPFGLGYRRCAGEIFVMKVLDETLRTFAPLDWEVGTTGEPASVCVAPFSCVTNNIYAVAAAPSA